MKRWGKAMKIMGFVLLGVGVCMTAGGGVLLHQGLYTRFNLEPIIGRLSDRTVKREIGIGALNFRDYYEDGKKISLEEKCGFLFDSGCINRNKLLNKGSYQNFVNKAKRKKYAPATDDIIKTYNKMLAGSILVSIFSVITIISIILLIITYKKQKQNKH